MSNITVSQGRTEFLLGQIAQAAGDYFVLVNLREEAREEYLEAIAAYEIVADDSPDFTDAQENIRQVYIKLKEQEPVVKLLQSLKDNLTDILDSGWQKIKTFTDISDIYIFRQQPAFEYSLRGDDEETLPPLAKKIDLSDQVVALVVIVTEEDEEVSINLRVYPTGNQTFLPENLELRLIDECGEIIETVTATSNDDYMTQPLSGEPGEKFGVQIVLGNISVTENFVI